MSASDRQDEVIALAEICHDRLIGHVRRKGQSKMLDYHDICYGSNRASVGLVPRGSLSMHSIVSGSESTSEKWPSKSKWIINCRAGPASPRSRATLRTFASSR